MNTSTSFLTGKRFSFNTEQAPTGVLTCAFNLPHINAYSALPLSQWNGKPVCQPRVVLTTRNIRVATGRRKLLAVSQRTNDTESDVPIADLPRSPSAANGELLEPQVVPASSRPTSIWLFVLENAVQVTILALAIAGSIHTRRRILMHLVTLLSLPQLALIASRIWRRIRSPVQSLLAPVDASDFAEDRELVSAGEDDTSVAEAVPSQEESNQEEPKGDLLLAQSKLISTSIRTVVAEEVDSLRYAIEQIEVSTEQREQARNLAIAEAIASLDGSLRSLRRSIDTRNQVQKSAPFALVSELEIMKSRLKQAEQEKAEVEVRFRAAEDNFEEAKRQGERARREADEATSKELSLRTELAVATSRLHRLEDVTERLDKAERRNDELQEQLINGTREQEGLRQSAEDAARRVVRVENIAKVLRDKIQELSGKSLSQYGQEVGDLFGDAKEKIDEEFWPQRLRDKGDLQPDSVIYQELLREEKGSRSPKWPLDPLGIEGGNQDKAQLKKLRDDGGFGVGDSIADQTASNAGSDNKLLSPEGSSEAIFSFSRGEFDSTKVQGERKTSEEDTQSRKESSKSPAEPSILSSEESVSVDSQKQDASKEDTPLTEDHVDKVSKVPPAATAEELSVQAVGGKSKSKLEAQERAEESVVEGGRESDLELETSEGRKYEPDATAVSKPSSHVQVSEDTVHYTGKQTPIETGKEEHKGSVTDSSRVPASFESTAEESHLGKRQDDLRYDSEKHFTEEKRETIEEPVASIERDILSEREREPEHIIERDTAPSSGREPQKDERTVPEERVVSAESSDSDHLATASSTSTQEQSSEDVAPEVTADEDKVATVQKTTSYLESLDQKEPARRPETVKDQLQTARELVKKARTRGLAVKQADLLFQRATKKLEDAIERADDRSEVEADLGGCLLAWAKTNIADPSSQERLSRALKLLLSSAESQPNNETVLFNTGLCLCLVASTSSTEKAMKDYHMACDMYERLLQLNESSRMACFNCGLAYVSLGRLSREYEDGENSRGYFERAIALFQRSLELKPGDSKAISYLDDCRRQLRDVDGL